MEIKRKTLRRSEWTVIPKREVRVASVERGGFSGAAGVFTVGKMERPFVVGELTLADEGYRWLQLAPRGGHWWLTSMFDPAGALREIYFDITLENDFSDPDDPAFFDLFLDLTVAPDGTAALLDRDELDRALAEGTITRAQHALAVRTAEELLSALRADPARLPRALAALIDTI